MCSLHGQTDMTIKMDTSTTMAKCYKPLLSFESRYYFDALKNTRTTLANNNFMLDQEAFEYQVRIYNLPKIFYYQQLGTLNSGNYASVTGFGVKEDLRWNIVKNSWFIFAPTFELGLGYYKLNVAKGVSVNTISTVLASQIESYSLDNFVLSGDLGLDMGFGFDVEGRRFSMVFSGGYIANVPSEWRLVSSLAFKEKINLLSPYAGVTAKLDLQCFNCDN